MRLIEHLLEPSLLYLVWQAPEGRSRVRRNIAELNNNNGTIILRYLFGSSDFESAILDGFRGFPAFKIGDKEHRNNVVGILLKRLPSKNRLDFTRYLRKFAIPDSMAISDFALLGYTEAKLPSDGFSIVNPFDGMDGPCEFVTEIAGYRYYSGMDAEFLETAVCQAVEFKAEDGNSFDSNAVQIFSGDRMIGYVNKLQALAFRRWLTSGSVKGWIQRINGTAERPFVNVFVEVKKA